MKQGATAADTLVVPLPLASLAQGLRLPVAETTLSDSDAACEERASKPRFERLWLMASLLAATIPVAGVFTLTKIFFVRDLTLAFRSRFLFLRHSVFAGTWPMWDPYPGNGQSAANDALYQLFHLPSLIVRLALPDVIAFNAWVALPIPLAALGTYLFLRRQVSAPAASFGAVAFAAAGPIVSTTNFPNMSWSVAAVPFVFWAIERVKTRPAARDGAVLAAIVGCQALAGEPVTLAATLLIASAYALFVERGWRSGRFIAVCAAGLIAGILLAAVQFVPLGVASRLSVRGLMRTDDFWSLHPLAFAELVAPHFFGDHFNSHLRELTWMVALNSHREPFYYTMYLGVPVVLAAALAAVSHRRSTTFWTVAALCCIIASLGSYTPIYPALQTLVPAIKTFRFPVKYLSLAAFGIAVLAGFTIDWLLEADVPSRALRSIVIVAVGAAAAVYGVIAWLLVAPAVPLHLFFTLASWAHLNYPIQGAEYIAFRARPLLTALFLKLLCTAFLLWIAGSARRERRTALVVLVLFAVVDLLAANSSVNPTVPAAWIEAPGWTQRVDRSTHQRVYVGGRLFGDVDSRDIDAPKYATGFDELTDLERRYVTVNELLFHTSGVQIRDSISYDLPVLWPIQYAQMLTRFSEATREERLRVVTRSGGRYVVLPTPPYPGAQPLATLRGVEQMKLYDLNPSARRAYIVPDALLGSSVAWQIEGLFQPRFDPASGVLVSEPPPPPAGRPGPATTQSAAFLEDGVNRVTIRASLVRDGYLVLLDSYDPFWRVTADGADAPLMRANGLFRAVHLTRGEHIVSFAYRPVPVYVGAAMTALTVLGLLLWCVCDRPRALLQPA